MSNPNTANRVDERGIDLWFCLMVLKKRFILITLITLLAVTAGGAYSYYTQRTIYDARAILLVAQAAEKPQAVSQKNDLDSIINSAYSTPVLTMNTYLGQIKSEALMQRVIEKLHLGEKGYTNRALAGQINAAVEKDSNLIDVRVTSGSRDMAISIANTLSNEYIAMMAEKNQEAMDRSIKFMQDQVLIIKEGLTATKDPAEKQRLEGVLTSLSQGITRTQIARSVGLGSNTLVLVSPAMEAGYTVTPDMKLYLAAALLLGLMVSMGLALLIEIHSTISQPGEETSTINNEKNQHKAHIVIPNHVEM
jgi:capsular polysaccharide biosynthesis protein